MKALILTDGIDNSDSDERRDGAADELDCEPFNADIHPQRQNLQQRG